MIKCGVLKVDSDLPTMERIKLMSEKIEDLIRENNIKIVVLEDTQYQNNWNTFQVLCQLQGVILKSLFEINLPFQIVSPSMWRKCCNIKGRDRKTQKANTQAFVKDKFGIYATEDEADAIGLSIWAIENIEMGGD